MVEDLRLVVSELVTNAVTHARTSVTVTLQELPFCVMLTVHEHPPARRSGVIERAGDTGGRGLAIVEQVSSEWGVSPGVDGDKSVWASFDLKPALISSDSAFASASRRRLP